MAGPIQLGDINALTPKSGYLSATTASLSLIPPWQAGNRYSFTVRDASSLQMKGRCVQSIHVPGGPLNLQAVLTE